MKIVNVTPGIIPIPPNGWGAVEKIIWETHLNLQKLGHDSIISYLDDVPADADIVHIHVANLANMAYDRGIPYWFTMHDHHSYLNGKDSFVYQENLLAMQRSIKSFVPAKYLVEYFDNIPEYFSHGVNTEYFTPAGKLEHKLLCVANNGYIGSQEKDRKGFGIAIEAARGLNIPITIAGPSNNKNYFDAHPPTYSKLNILYDLNEEQLLTVYKDHTIFVHASELEAGHPNLTLLEALSCGLPVVGTLEQNNSLKGMVPVSRDIVDVTLGIQQVLLHYGRYSQDARQQAIELSWYNRTKELVTLYENTGNFMKDKLLKHYNNTPLLKKTVLAKHNFHVIDGAFMEILGGSPTAKYDVSFVDKKTNTSIYNVTLGSNTWGKTAIKYYVDWKVVIKDLETNQSVEHHLNLKDKRVLISLESKSLGDTLAWLPYADEFRKKHGCKLVCSTFWNHLFKDEYPDMEFVEPGKVVDNLTALYRLGLFYNGDDIDKNNHPNNPIQEPLQKIASDILGLDYKEIRPLMKQPDISNEGSKQIAIAIHSTTQAKYWNNPFGWQAVVNWLQSRGYTVKLISKEGLTFMGNKAPAGVILHPDGPIESVIEELKKSKAFIGIGSGLSWLSWALHVPTVLISGFSYKWAEMQDCIRIGAPKGRCEGCFNRHKLNAGDWNWCPDHKGTPRQFECSREITADMVIEELEKIL